MKNAIIEPLESRIAPASIIVNTLSDQIDTPGSKTVSLRDAVAFANAQTTPTTILFKHGLVGEIGLISGASYGELLLTHPVTIIGPGPGVLTISAHSSNSRIFDFEASASISGISLISGNGAGLKHDGSGGAIYSDQSLTLSHVVLSGNTTATGKGGGVYVEENSPGISVSVKNCVISGNTSANGAGGMELYASKSIQIVNTLITGNTGASASNYGGGLVASLSSSGTGLGLSGDTIVNNKGGGSTYGGGANLGSEGAPISVINSTISGNTAENKGGGLYLYQPSGDGITSVKNTLLANNSGSYGGGIFVRGGDKLSLSGVTAEGNQASGRGGGFYGEGNSGAVVISAAGSHFVDNSAALNGGGMAVTKSASLSLAGATVSGNHSYGGGGGVFISGSGNLSISGGAISSNVTGGVGGGIYAPSSGNVTITGTTFSHNVCNASDGGGALLANTSATVKLTGLTVTGNDAIGYGGGGVFIDASSSTSRFTISGGNFSGNFAGADGGGIEVLGIGSGTISGAVITGNIAANDAGGLLDDLSTASNLKLTGDKVTGNIAIFEPNIAGI